MKVFFKCKAKRDKNLQYSVVLTHEGDHKIESGKEAETEDYINQKVEMCEARGLIELR